MTAIFTGHRRAAVLWVVWCCVLLQPGRSTDRVPFHRNSGSAADGRCRAHADSELVSWGDALGGGCLGPLRPTVRRRAGRHADRWPRLLDDRRQRKIHETITPHCMVPPKVGSPNMFVMSGLRWIGVWEGLLTKLDALLTCNAASSVRLHCLGLCGASLLSASCVKIFDGCMLVCARPVGDKLFVPSAGRTYNVSRVNATRGCFSTTVFFFICIRIEVQNECFVVTQTVWITSETEA